MGKTLGTRQKLNFRIEPSQRNVKPRNPLLPPARQWPPQPVPDLQQEPETGSGKTSKQKLKRPNS